jgi:hypothetical protein
LMGILFDFLNYIPFDDSYLWGVRLKCPAYKFSHKN